MTTLTYQPMIRGAEVWAPSESAVSLRFTDSISGSMHESSPTVVERIVADKAPFILNVPLHATDESHEALIGIPIIAEDQLRAVLTLVVHCDKESLGAIEIWSRNSRDELGLNGGVFSNLGRFAKISQYVRFPRGSGLPGQCWEDRRVKLIRGLGRSSNFMRASGARASGLDVGVGIPLMNGAHNLGSVLLLLSSETRPIARVFEIWDVDADNECFDLKTSATAQCKGTVAEHKRLAFGQGILGSVLTSGIPVVTKDLSDIESQRATAAAADGLTSAIAIPVYVGERVKSVFVMFN